MSLYFAGFLLCLLLFSTTTFAQRCATVEYQELLQENNAQSETKSQFEYWINQKIRNKKAQNGTSREQATVYIIPVVVHVIHNGEALGVGRNIPDEQIASQIQVLTEDFRRMNGDAGNTPAMFLPVAADIELEFTLAKQDPEGLPTNGIVRVDGHRSEWSLADNYDLKSLSYWPAEEYLNIWVTDLSGSYLGYAQFPTTDMLSGLDNASNSKVTDGVVIDYRAFGSKDIYPSANLLNAYSLGRSTTHEVGHFFGLRHIWGDDSGGCTESDYVDDTPNQGGSTTGCPGTNPSSCGSTDMIQNYMDYTDDACMNLFTQGQKDRIRVILDNSPRRASLKTSKGALAPTMVSNDLGIRNIVDPGNYACGGIVTPALQVRNYGDNTITSEQLTLKLDGVVQETASLSLNLASLEIDTIHFSPVNLTTAGSTHTLEFEITAVNGTTDGNADNNLSARQVTIPESISLPIVENFNTTTTGGMPAKWTTRNPDDLLTWEAVSTNNGEAGNKSLYVNFYNYEVEGEYDTLLTPVFDLTTVSFAVLSFDRAYANYPGVSSEGLIVKLSTNCGQSFDYTLFESYGTELATVAETSSPFTPSGPSDWKRECLVLNDFLGQSNLRVAFIARNDYGNNLYIDNINLDDSDNTSSLKDLGIVALGQPSLVSCSQELQPTVIVNNQGCTIENQFTLSYQFDSGSLVTNTYPTADIKPGETVEIPLETLTFPEGKHDFNLQLINNKDKNITNDTLSGRFYINQDEDHLPVKEDFEDFSSSDWVIVNDDNDITWETLATNKGTSLYLDARSYSGAGQDEWLVSPVLDFSNVKEATLSFDLAYSYSNDSKDGLTIKVSTDCGVSYDDVVFSRFGEELNTGEFSDTPNSDSVWSKINLNLNDYLGEQNVRIAFISTNSNGNNIYIDNIQTFVTQHFVSGINEIYPNPSPDGIFNITFDLPKKERVQIGVYTLSGQKLMEETLEDILNQTYTFNFSNKTQGIYLVKVAGESFSYVKRIFLQP